MLTLPAAVGRYWLQSSKIRNASVFPGWQKQRLHYSFSHRLLRTHAHIHKANSLHLRDTVATLFFSYFQKSVKKMRLRNNCPRLNRPDPHCSFVGFWDSLKQENRLRPSFLNPLVFTLNAAVNAGLPQEARVGSFRDAEPEVLQENKHLPHGGGNGKTQPTGVS